MHRSTLLFLALAAACGRDVPMPPPGGAPTANTAAPSARPPTHADTVTRADALAATAGPAAAAAMKTIGGRLAFEARHRPSGPSGGTRAEDVLAALARAGITVSAPRQYVAMTVKADYCVGGQTPEGLAIAVCEYSSPAAATAGRAYVIDRFRVPGLARVIHVRGATTLALGHHADQPLDGLVARAEGALANL